MPPQGAPSKPAAPVGEGVGSCLMYMAALPGGCHRVVVSSHFQALHLLLKPPEPPGKYLGDTWKVKKLRLGGAPSGAAYVLLLEGDSEVVSDAIPESGAKGPQTVSRILRVSRGGTYFDTTTLESSFQVH